MTIDEFCFKFNACKKGWEWARENCETMQEAWEKCPNPKWLIWMATRRGILTDKELRLFACSCMRQIWHLLTDERSREAVETAEKLAIGATKQKTAEAWKAVMTAAMSAETEAVRIAAWDAARDAANDNASEAAWATARAVAWEMAREAATKAATKAARDAVMSVGTDTEKEAALATAWEEAWNVSWNTTWDATWDATWDKARAAQAAWLKTNTKPKF